MTFDEFYLVSTSIVGKGRDATGEFEINGRIDNGSVVFGRYYSKDSDPSQNGATFRG